MNELHFLCFLLKGEVAKKADLIKSFEDIPSGNQTEICKIILAKVVFFIVIVIVIVNVNVLLLL